MGRYWSVRNVTKMAYRPFPVYRTDSVVSDSERLCMSHTTKHFYLMLLPKATLENPISSIVKFPGYKRQTLPDLQWTSNPPYDRIHRPRQGNTLILTKFLSRKRGFRLIFGRGLLCLWGFLLFGGFDTSRSGTFLAHISSSCPLTQQFIKMIK